MAQFKAEAGKVYKNPITGAQVSYTADQLKDPAAGMLSSDFQEYTTGQTPLAQTGMNQSPSQIKDVAGQGISNFGFASGGTPQTSANQISPSAQPKDVNVITSVDANQKVADSAQASNTGLTKLEQDQSRLEMQYAQKAAKQQKLMNEEAALKQVLGSVNATELANKNLEEQRTQKAAEFRLGQTGTYYQENAADKAKQAYEGQVYRLNLQDQILQNQITQAYDNNNVSLAKELQDKKDALVKNARQAQDDAFNRMIKMTDLDSKLSKDADTAFEQVAKSGVPLDAQDMSFLEQKYNLPQGMGAIKLGAYQADVSSKASKEKVQNLIDQVQLQTGLINLTNLPEKTRLDMQKAVQELQSSSINTANKIFETIKNQPVGVPLNLPDASYLGIKGAGIVERSKDGTSVLMYHDSSGKVQTREFSFMPDPKDSEQVYINGVPALRDKSTGVIHPITDGENVINKDAGFSKTFPVGSKGGQCGAFVHNLVSDYPYGLNTIDQKKSAVNVQKGEPMKVGDCLFQAIGGDSGHVSVIDWVGKDDKGEEIYTVTESNIRLDEKVTQGRPIKASDPTIVGAFRGSLRPEFITGSDVGPRRNDETQTSSVTQGIQTYGLTIPSASPFLVGTQNSTQNQAAIQNELSARSYAKQLVDGLITNPKDVDQNVRTRAIEIAQSNGYMKPGEVKPFQADEASIRSQLMENLGFTPAPGSAQAAKLDTDVKAEVSRANATHDDLQKGFNNLLTRGGIKADQRASLKENWSSIVNSGNLAEAENFLESAAVDTMSATQKGEFSDVSDGSDFASSAYQLAKNMKENPIVSGPYREVIEKAKPFLTISKDPDIVRLRQEVESAQAKIRRSYYGTAVTANESATADSMLVNFEKDDINTVIDKLGRMGGYLKFQNDKQVNRILGLPKPVLSDYVPE
jgi:hypothetical protein